MELRMISHASVLIQSGSISILTDPWLVGDAFNESWSLLCEPALSPEALQGVTHIWISHEHPDHLSFPTLKAIPAEERRKITLLYQKHWSNRVALALANLGFCDVIELPLTRWYDLGGISLACFSVGTIDSILAVRSGGVTLLNTNDCIFGARVARWLARRIGPVDLLLTQFSIANWVGNPGDSDAPARKRIVDRMRLYIEVFKPRVTVPFASYVYFSHEENRHMNAWINTPDYVCEQLAGSSTKVQFLSNGDSWSSAGGSKLEGDPLAQYRAAFGRIPLLPYRSHPSYGLAELLSLARRLIGNVRQSFPALLLRRARAIRFYVIDLGIAILFDMRSGIARSTLDREEQCDIAVSSQALWFAFRFPWGFATLEVSGRYKRMRKNASFLALYLCHLWSSDMHFGNLASRLLGPRAWQFTWSKRVELLERVLQTKRAPRASAVSA